MKPEMQTVWAEFLVSYYEEHPALTLQDMEKLLYQSTFGGRHLMPEKQRVESEICRELDQIQDTQLLCPLPGTYTRVHLGYLKESGLSAGALADLFCRSASRIDGSAEELEEKMNVVRSLCGTGKLPFSREEADRRFAEWKQEGYPARRHSPQYRDAYHPAYRVIAKEYVQLLPLLAEIEGKFREKPYVVLAIEGCAGSGKSTLAELLREMYGAEVVHTDDFFLRPQQLTEERYAQPGGNMDRERLEEEVLLPLLQGEREICYRPFDCHTMALQEPVKWERSRLVIVEGSYSMHPQLEKYYDLSVFLRVTEQEQRERILRRNGPVWAQMFFDRWIPLENIYFTETFARSRCRFQLEGDCYERGSK